MFGGSKFLRNVENFILDYIALEHYIVSWNPNVLYLIG